MDVETGVASSDEFFEDERVVAEEQGGMDFGSVIIDERPLDYQRFGVSELEKLFEKVDEVVVLLEDPVWLKKFVFGFFSVCRWEDSYGEGSYGKEEVYGRSMGK
ncbi:hypothetical protein L6452_39322 [Arctium lappa]|uniref:Uncharacterized protein n=1 Tax=Arctium lappa TaxID=4217 RepID=A0ACB8XRZ5_ARCLA|nr:hypothetical protein L6452_39322 [Arctium lappa]